MTGSYHSNSNAATRSPLMTAKMRFSGQHGVITVPRDHIKFCQSIGGGVLLSQIIYWTAVVETKWPERDGWFYKTYDEWMDEIWVPRKAVIAHIAEFVRQGFVETKTKKNPQGAPTKWYRFLPEMFEPLYEQFLETQCSLIAVQHCERHRPQAGNALRWQQTDRCGSEPHAHLLLFG